MKYMGSKSKIAKYIVPIIQDYINKTGAEWYLEPFVGGANIIDKITNCDRIGSDKSKYLIALYQNLDKLKELPDVLTKEHYAEVRDSYHDNDKKFPDWYIGAIGYLGSFNGRFFDGGYAGTRRLKDGTVRDYYDEAKRNLVEQVPSLKYVWFMCKDYQKLEKYLDIENFVIYCDPPYKDTKEYGDSQGFSHRSFWRWCRQLSWNNTVIVSEQEAPDDFKCIWEMPSKRTINPTETKAVTEKLFIYNNE